MIMYKLKKTCWLLAALTAFAAHAGDAPAPADVRCLIVGMRVAGLADATQRNVGVMLTYYYYGRLEKVSQQDLVESIGREDVAMTQSAFKTEALRCGRVLEEKGKALAQIGEDLTAHSEDNRAKTTVKP